MIDYAEARAAAERATVNLRSRGEDLTWYALKVPPQREFAAEAILRKLGLSCFVPVEMKYPRVHKYRRRARDKNADPKKYPMFVGYLFAGFAGLPPMWELDRVNVITGIVGFDKRPLALPAAAVDYLRKLSGAEIPWRRAPNPHKSFRVGDTVEVIEGAFTGHMLPIVGIDAKMAQFVMQFMGKQQKLKIPLEFLAAA